ncbi:MAG: NB-ARC domain-containing protein [Cyanobacteria bacterium J06639_14]
MTFEDALTTLESLWQKSFEKSFTPLEQSILESAWHQESYTNLAQRLYLTEGHVKDTAANLWKQISHLLDIKVTKRTLRGLMEHPPHRVTLAPLPAASRPSPSIPLPASIDWADAPDIGLFLGRQIELQMLEQWIIHDRCRVITLMGMGGIGKTALAAQLGRRIQEQFEFVIWRSLINAPPLSDTLRTLISLISRQQDTEVAPSLDEQLLKLLAYLRQHRCLIVLDNVETILAEGAGQPYRSGYDNYDQLFRRLGETSHKSCCLLTSREKPPAIARLEGPSRPVRSQLLSGLAQAEARQVIESFQDFQASPATWQALIDLYAGHPLALELVAKHIEDVFFGDVAAFLQAGQPVFGDIGALLDWHFERLSEAEIEVLYWLGIHREPVALTELQTCVLEQSPQLPSTLQSLKRRLPLLQTQQRFTVQPVLLEHITYRFVQQMSQAIVDGELRSLDRFSLMQMSAQDYLRRTQIRVIVQPIQQNCEAKLDPSKSLESHLWHLLQQLQATSLTGYAAGNMINLLVVAGASLKHQDLSALTVREADLQGCELWDTRFSGTHFDRVAFTQSLKGVLAVAISAEASLVAASDSDGVIHLYEADTGQYRFNLRDPHQSPTWIYAIAFTPQGDALLSSGLDKTLRLWDSQTGELLRVWHLGSPTLAVACHPQGQYFACAGTDANLYLWQSDGTQPIAVLSGHEGWVWSVAFGPDGTWLASSGSDGTIRLWDTATGATSHVLQGHQGRVQAITISPDGYLLASAGDDQTLKLWDSQTGVLLASLEGHQNIVRSVAFHGDGQWLASTGYDGTIKLWDVTWQRCIKTLHNEGTNRLDVLAFGRRGDRLIAGSKDQTLQLWDVGTGQCVRTLQGFVCGTTSLACSTDGRYLASSGLDHFVWLWDLATGRCLHQLKGHQSNVWSVAISPDGRTLASGSYDNTFRLWDIASGKCLKTCHGHRHFVRSVAFAPTGMHVASASSDGTLKLWDSFTGQCLKTFYGHTDKVQQVRFMADGKQLVSCGNDRMIHRWDIATGSLVRSLTGHNEPVSAIALHPHAPYLVSSSNAILKLWNLDTGDCLATWEGHENLIWSVAFSPDGDCVASSSNDKTVRLWDVATGKCQHVLEHTVVVGAVAFSPNGKNLICGCFNEQIPLYRSDTGERLQVLRIPRPYEGMQIRGITGLQPGEIANLRDLGAIA